jgi:CheY-like chemotaxis protein
VRAILVDVPSRQALSCLLEQGAEDRELGPIDPSMVTEGEWLTVEVRAGQSLTQVPARVRDLGEGPHIVLIERDWQHLQSFAARGEKSGCPQLPKSGISPIVRGHVLVASAEPCVVNVITATLQSAGYCTTSVTSSEEVWTSLARCPVSLLVLDSHLPDGSAQALCLRLGRLAVATRPAVLTLICCASLEGRDVLGSGSDDFLVTPFRQQELLARVSSLLCRHGEGALVGAA